MIDVFYEATPNPHSMKFNFTDLVCEESASFDDSSKSGRSPLASKIFGFPWTSSIHLGPNFITVTKQDWVEWEVIAEPLSNLIKEHVNKGEPVLHPEIDQEATEDDDPVIKNIKIFLNEKVRPAVAMDGGDVVFSRFVN